MTTKSIRIDEGLAHLIERESRLWDRTINKQVEHLLKIGRLLAGKIDIADILAVSQGIKTIKIELSPAVHANPVDSDEVFSDLENKRVAGSLSGRVTSARDYYEASLDRPGYLDCVNSITGERQTGIFEDGEFKPAL